MQPKIASPLLANFLVRCEELGLTGDQTLVAVKRAAAFDPEIAAEFKKEAVWPLVISALTSLGPALWRAGKGLFGAGATAAKAAPKAVPTAIPARPPVSTLLSRPKAPAVPAMPKLAAAFLDRCDELGLTEAETLVAVKRAMAADPAAAAAFEKVGRAGLVRGLSSVAGWLGKQFSRLGSKTGKPTPAGAPVPGLPPASAAAKPGAAPTPAATAPAAAVPASATPPAPGAVAPPPASLPDPSAMRQSHIPEVVNRPSWFGRNKGALGSGATIGAFIGIPTVMQNMAEGKMRTEVAESNDRSGQLALAAQGGDPNMLSAFAQQHKLQPHAAAALTRLAAVPEFRAQLTNQQTAGHLMHQLRLFAAMPGMTEDNLTGMLANQLEPGVGMKTVTAAAGLPVGMSRLLANLKTKLMGSPEAPGFVRQLRDTGGAAMSNLKKLLRDEWRGGSKNLSSTAPAVGYKPRGPALSTRVSDLLGIPGGKIRGLGLSAKKHIYDTSMTDVSPFLRHPATQVTGLVGAGAASPFAYDYLSGSKTPEEVTFKAGQAASPEATERALSAAPIPMPGVVAPPPPPPRVAVPDTAGPSFMSRLGTGASDVWGGLSKTHKGLLLGGGGLLANHLLKETTGYGADLGTPGLLAGLGTAGYGLSGGSFGGLLDNIKKIIGMQGDDAPPAGDAADVAAAARGSPELATFRTRINERPSATSPAGPAAAGGLTLQQAAIDPRFSKYFKGGQPDTRALAGANDADLVTAITALDKPSRATLRQQVDAYQPSMMERTFGNADHHKRRFQGLLAKVGSRLVKAAGYSKSEDWSPTTRRLNPDRSSNIIAAIGTPDHPDSFYWTARKANNDAEYQADIAKHFRGPVLMRLGADDPTPDVGTPTPVAAGPSFLARNLPYLAGGGLLAGIGGYGAYRLLRSRRKKDEDEDEEKSASRSPINDLPLVSLRDLSPSGPLMPVEPNSVYAAVGPPRPTSVWSSLSDPHKAVLAGGGALTAATLLERVYRRLRRKHEDPDDEGPTLGAGAALLGAGAAAYGLGSGRMPRLGENAAHLLADGKAGLRAGKGHVGELLGGLRDRIGV